MKTLKLLVATLATAMLLSCGETKPSDVAIKSIEYMYRGEMNAYVELLTGTEEQKQNILSMYEEKGDELAKTRDEKLGELKDIKVIKETISEDGNSAKVELEITYSKEEPAKDLVELTKVDGKWLVNNPLANK